MKVFICEDNNEILKKIEQVIKNYIMINDLSIEIITSSTDPLNILEEAPKHGIANCYFLDIDLGESVMSGIDLGKKIRDIDPFAKLIYITNFDNMQVRILNEMIAPLAYIIKNNDDINEKIRTSLTKAYEQYIQSTKLNSNIGKVPIKVGLKQEFYDINELLYFEALEGHKIRLNLVNNKEIVFFGKISNLEILHPSIYICHRSYAINLDNIDKLDSETVIFKDETSIYISSKTIRRIKKEIKNR